MSTTAPAVPTGPRGLCAWRGVAVAIHAAAGRWDTRQEFEPPGRRAGDRGRAGRRARRAGVVGGRDGPGRRGVAGGPVLGVERHLAAGSGGAGALPHAAPPPGWGWGAGAAACGPGVAY